MIASRNNPSALPTASTLSEAILWTPKYDMGALNNKNNFKSRGT